MEGMGSLVVYVAIKVFFAPLGILITIADK